MPSEPSTKRAVAFVDGQNLYHSVREAFGYTYPNYDVSALSRNICRSKGWELLQVRFYTGIPDSSDDAFWSAFWVNKLRVLSWQQVHVYSRPLRYRNKRVTLPDGTAHRQGSPDGPIADPGGAHDVRGKPDPDDGRGGHPLMPSQGGHRP